ncbi:MAG: ribonuclease HI family protein [Candidatus Nanoarchaeia archaeon]|jgi:ribonuclease HI
MNLIIYTDGASRGNPGYAAIGYRIENEQGLLEEHGEYVGVTTNNEAEYRAIVKALKSARKYAPSEVKCYSDSLLIISQIKGEWKVKHPQMRDYYENVKALEKEFKKISYTHVRRNNKGVSRCDELANEALDKRS